MKPKPLTTRLIGSSWLALAIPTAALAQTILPPAPPPFAGKIGQTYADSTPAFPKPVTAPAGAPNILLILTDDTGFGAASTFGGPVPTPNLDVLADACGFAHRAQSSCGGQRHRRQSLHRLSRL